QFEDALVTSAVVVFQNTAPDSGSYAEFSFGGSMLKPRSRIRVSTGSLKPHQKWMRYFHTSVRAQTSDGPVLGDYFKIRRGIATGANNFFILSKNHARELGIITEHIKPILPSPRYMPNLVVESDRDGFAELEKKLGLIDCSLPEEQLAQVDPGLAKYLA